MSLPTFTNVQIQSFSLKVRASVALRERAIGHGVWFYLSLFDDEIDERFDNFLSQPGYPSKSSTKTIPEPWAFAAGLELTDVAIFFDPGANCIVLRGGACTVPLYWSSNSQGIALTTSLPLEDGGSFSRAGFASFLASACLHGSYEPNASTETPLAGWRRTRRGAITTFDLNSLQRERAIADERNRIGEAITEEGIIASIQTAFAQYSRSQRHVRSSVLELSGGFDSTLAGSAAQGPANTMHGVSVEYPYYEFRFEAPIQREVGTALAIDRHVIDGTTILPYSPAERTPRFDEPTVFVTGIGHAERVAAFATGYAASKIYMGHGGDQIFSTDLLESEKVAFPSLDHALFTHDLQRRFGAAMNRLRNPEWLRRSSGCFVYDARQDIWVKETFGATIRTPFADLALFRAAKDWSALSQSQHARPDKTILQKSMANYLPAAVVNRKGKVAYDGVWARAYAAQCNSIASVIEVSTPVLEQIGLSPRWLQRRIQQLANWQPISARELLAAYALASWICSWELHRSRRLDLT